LSFNEDEIKYKDLFEVILNDRFTGKGEKMLNSNEYDVFNEEFYELIKNNYYLR